MTIQAHNMGDILVLGKSQMNIQEWEESDIISINYVIDQNYIITKFITASSEITIRSLSKIIINIHTPSKDEHRMTPFTNLQYFSQVKINIKFNLIYRHLNINIILSYSPLTSITKDGSPQISFIQLYIPNIIAKQPSPRNINH